MGEHISLEEAVARRIAMHATHKKLVFTNGHFDLLHIGHLDYLEKARALGDALFVGINGDPSSELLKGTGRPIVPAVERARLIAALVPVSAAIIFEEETANAILTALQPDIYVKGGDYHDKPLPERDTVRAFGGKIVLIDYLPGHSTSALIAKIKQLP